jgi:hypothetical protein
MKPCFDKGGVALVQLTKDQELHETVRRTNITACVQAKRETIKLSMLTCVI